MIQAESRRWECSDPGEPFLAGNSRTQLETGQHLLHDGLQ